MGLMRKLMMERSPVRMSAVAASLMRRPSHKILRRDSSCYDTLAIPYFALRISLNLFCRTAIICCKNLDTLESGSGKRCDTSGEETKAGGEQLQYLRPKM